MKTNVISRSLHDLGLSAWFGGTLANAVALNSAASKAGDPKSTGAVTNAGWAAWTPVNAVAIGAHLVGSVGQLIGNADRLTSQKGVGTMSIIKTGVTVVALGLSAYSRVISQKIAKYGDVPAASGTDPVASTPPEVANAQKQLKILQWMIPAVTGGLVVVTSVAGEQQRPASVLSGVTEKFKVGR